MARYRIEVVDFDDRLLDHEEIEAEDDQKATQMLPDKAPIYSDHVRACDNVRVKLYRYDENNLIYVGECKRERLVIVSLLTLPSG